MNIFLFFSSALGKTPMYRRSRLPTCVSRKQISVVLIDETATNFDRFNLDNMLPTPVSKFLPGAEMLLVMLN